MSVKRWMVAVAAVVALCGFALAQDDYNNNHARSHGYRHGYVDGYHHGQEDRGERESYDVRSEDYARADRGYDPSMGDKDDFQDAYRKGYKDGYDDGYYNRNSRFGVDEDYGGYWNRGGDQGRNYNDADDSGNYQGDYGRGYNRVPGISRDPRWTAMDPKSIGYRTGIEVGLDDWMAHRAFTPTEGHRYHDADAWYDQATTHEDFKNQFRRGYVEGYQDAFNGERWHRVGGDGSFGDGFRTGMLWGFKDNNRGKPFNPTRLPDYRSHGADAQYQDGFMKGYEWVFRLRQQR